MARWVLILVAVISFAFQSTLSANAESRYPNAVHKIVLHKDKTESYTILASRIGFELLKQYSYTEYVDIKRQNEVGIAGNYDFLLLSTGGNEWDDQAYQKFIKQPCGWETTYYKNHDLTVIHEVCRDDSRTYSYVRILKVGQGRLPDLHLE